MQSKAWLFTRQDISPKDAVLNGNRFLLGNGYMGYRGTLEEAGKDSLAGCMLNGVYDQVPGKWREPVNAPNGLFTRIEGVGGIDACEQSLDLRHGRMRRRTGYGDGGKKIVVTTERFVSHADVHLICLEYTVCPAQSGRLVIQTGIDTDVWDINGPHLEKPSCELRDDVLHVVARTEELGITIAVCEAIECDSPASVEGSLRTLKIDAEAGAPFTFRKFVSIYTSLDACDDPVEAARAGALRARATGYAGLGAAHDARWEDYWDRCDVRIEGDAEAQFALRYSLYHLLLAAPRHSDRVSIPARGLSGQVYKGAVFWDTEMFMTPVFSLTDPGVARNLILYRFHTLDGARRKAVEYGWRGAFYAWESQETGDDACTHFNVTDVFTNRPIRTYFRDKQIHVSADVAYAIWQYYEWTGDFTVFVDGAAEVMAECARFFHSYAYYKKDRQRYELLDVTGPDEYHERLNNNAFTNRMVQFTLDKALAVLNLLKKAAPAAYTALENKIGFEAELADWREMSAKLYLPAPDPKSGVIPQFDGYHTLEDISLKELKSRVLNPNEYLGGGNGLATTTQIIKQADVVLMLTLFKTDFPQAIKQANWEFYEPRTEHGSSLSACAYAMVAAEIGRPDWAYRYFLKTATVDLTGHSKEYLGTLYIGGTHPAANGGAWLAAVFGFAGLRAGEEGISLKPSLPSKWKRMQFNITWRGRRYAIDVSSDAASVTPCEENQRMIKAVLFDLDGVIVSTDEFHFQAWKQMADAEGIPFTRDDNERLRGVSRMESLDIILERATRHFTGDEKLEMAARKNGIYGKLLSNLTPGDILPGVSVILSGLRERHVKMAIGSSSKNAGPILQAIGLGDFFDAVVDGTHIQRSKPDPEVFTLAAERLGISPWQCLVVEDAGAGVDAAVAAGMPVLAVGSARAHPQATLRASDLADISVDAMLRIEPSVLQANRLSVGVSLAPN